MKDFLQRFGLACFAWGLLVSPAYGIPKIVEVGQVTHIFWAPDHPGYVTIAKLDFGLTPLQTADGKNIQEFAWRAWDQGELAYYQEVVQALMPRAVKGLATPALVEYFPDAAGKPQLVDVTLTTEEVIGRGAPTAFCDVGTSEESPLFNPTLSGSNRILYNPTFQLQPEPSVLPWRSDSVVRASWVYLNDPSVKAERQYTLTLKNDINKTGLLASNVAAANNGLVRPVVFYNKTKETTSYGTEASTGRRTVTKNITGDVVYMQFYAEVPSRIRCPSFPSSAVCKLRDNPRCPAR